MAQPTGMSAAWKWPTMVEEVAKWMEDEQNKRRLPKRKHRAAKGDIEEALAKRLERLRAVQSLLPQQLQDRLDEVRVRASIEFWALR